MDDRLEGPIESVENPRPFQAKLTHLRDVLPRNGKLLFCLLIIWLVIGANSLIGLEREKIRLSGLTLQLEGKCTQLEAALKKKPKEIVTRPDLTISVRNRMMELQPKLDPVLLTIIADSIVKYSKELQLSEVLITNLIYRESAFNPFARSSAGAVGLMQIVPRFHKPLWEGLKIEELYHVDNNVRVGCRILKTYMEKEGGDVEKALKRYVGGDSKGYVRDIFRLMAEHECGRYRNR